MSAVDDLTELVERAAAAERAALASKWRERRDVEALCRKARRALDEQWVLERGSAKAHELTGRRARLREAVLLDGDLDTPTPPADTAKESTVPKARSGGNARGTSSGTGRGHRPPAHGLRAEIGYIHPRNWRRSGSLKQFLIAFTVSYLIGYLVNLILIWRMFAAQELSSPLGGAIVPAILVILSSVVMWLLLTVFAVALSQQPKVRRALLREIADYNSNAEGRAFAEEAARERVTTRAPAGSSVRERAE
jgi:uncharacterized integral membrane protein